MFSFPQRAHMHKLFIFNERCEEARAPTPACVKEKIKDCEFANKNDDMRIGACDNE